MAPEFPFGLSPSMLAVRSRRANGTECNLADGVDMDDDASVRFGEGPRRITDLTETWPEALEALKRTGAPLGEAEVEEALDAMQADALDSLYALLDGAGVDRGERLVIGLDERGGVSVDEHPQRERVLALLESHPRVADKLRRMAALALTGRGVRDIARAEGMLAGHGGEGERVFQACLKGGLSHFHLLRK